MLDRLTTIRGARYSIGPEIGHGGEGVIYSIVENAGLAVKVYKPGRDSRETRAKVRQMVAMASADLGKHAAWPLDFAEAGVFALVMPRARGLEIHDLYGPKSRMVKMPKATFRFLVTTAYNLAAALHEIHRVGAVVGDFNQRNILVADDARVCFVDCDSFQITSGGQLFRCTVGTPDQLAPEVQRADLSTLVRLPNHDNFTLALLIFQLLFIGRHPFAGVGGPDDISDAIRRCLFAYGKRAASQGIRPPPHVPPADTVPATLFSLFERAFDENSSAIGRPTPAEWAQQLGLFRTSLVKCTANSAHEYIAGRATCPWCDLRVVLFLEDGQHVFRIDAKTINELADKLEHAAPYSYSFTLPSIGVVTPAALPAGLDKRGASFWFGIGLGLLALAGLFAGHWFLAIIVGFWACGLAIGDKSKSRRNEYRQKLEAELAAAENNQKSIETKLRVIHNRYTQDFDGIRRRVSPLKRDYNSLPAKRQQAIDDLNRRLRDFQLKQYLDQHFISRADIAGIGPKRLATLRAFGIETAADINWGMRAPGFGGDLRRKLVMWRQAREQTFRFNPNAQIDPREIQKIDAALNLRKSQIESEFHSINTQLDTRTRQLRAELEIAVADLPAATRAVAQAKANLSALNAGGAAAAGGRRLSFPVKLLLGLGGLVVGLAIVGILSNQRQPSAPPGSPPPRPTLPAMVPSGRVLLTTNADARVTIERSDGVGAQPVVIELASNARGQPIEQVLSAGSYRIKFEAPGWRQSKVAEVDVVPGKNIPLVAMFMRTDLDITSSPPGAAVEENGMTIGTTPFRAVGMTVEEHMFTFLQSGRPNGTLTVSLAENSRPINYVWPVGNIVIASTPTGAEVSNAGKTMGHTPLIMPDIAVGEYAFTLAYPGFASTEVRGVVKPNEDLALNATLTDVRPAKMRAIVAGDGKRIRLENIGERPIDVHRLYVRPSSDSGIESVSIERHLDSPGSVEVELPTVLRSLMTISVDAEPSRVELTLEREALAPSASVVPFPAKSIKAHLEAFDGRLAITNESSNAVRIQYLVITRSDSRIGRVTVGQDVAPKQSIFVRLHMRLHNGDSVQIATQPSLPPGTIDFSSD